MPAHIEHTDDAVVVTLGWPAVRNALGPDEAAEVADAVEEAVLRRATALVLTGEGAFCSGGDLRAFAELSERYAQTGVRTRVYGHVQRIFRALRRSPLPTVAAVDGAAVGLGMDLALACDMRFVGTTGWMQQGWARLGLIPAGGGAWFVEQASPGRLWDLLTDQRRLDGPACAELGLGTAVEGTAADAALERAAALARIPEDARTAYVELARGARWPPDDYLDRCADHQSRLIAGADFRRAAAALLG